jgi:hypothetical protein
VLGIGAVNNRFEDADGPAHYGPEAEPYGEQSAQSFEMAQREFNDRQMLPRQPMGPQPVMQQQQQIQPKKEE